MQVMIHSDPFQRPAASELLSLSIICPATQKSKVCDANSHLCIHLGPRFKSFCASHVTTLFEENYEWDTLKSIVELLENNRLFDLGTKV